MRRFFLLIEYLGKMDYEKKIHSLGLDLPPSPKPVASYIPVVGSGNLLFLSGILPFVDGQLASRGKLGKELTIEEGMEAARICLLNGLSVIRNEIGSLNKIEQFVRLAVHVASTAEFTQQPAIANGASELLIEIFGDIGKHARLALGAVVLPLDAPVELEMIVELVSMGSTQNKGYSIKV